MNLIQIKGSGTQVFNASNMTGKTSGVAAGTCSLPAGNINLGVKSISVTTTASKAVVVLYNKYGQTFDARMLTTGNTTVGSMTAVFDLADASDEQIDGLYVVVNMFSAVENYTSIGTYAGTVYGPFSINSITVTY